MVARFASVCGL